MHLAWRCGDQELLSNVRKLVANNISLSDVASVTLLLSPSIREIQISFDKNTLVAPSLSPIAAALFRDIVKTTAPNLTDLFLFERFPLSSSQIPLLGLCHNLRHICLSDRDHTVLDAGAIRLLERLGPLETMSLSIRLGECHTATDLDLKIGFPKLSYFNLAGSAVDVANFLVAARLVALKNLEVTLAGSTDMPALEECIAQMGAHLFQALRSLNMTVTTMPPQSPTAILGDVISPLYALKGLKSVGLDLGAYVPHTSDNDLIALACAWPKLDWLSIGGGSPPNVRRLTTLRRPTVRGLVELAQRCPRLRIINLPTLDTSQLPSPESVPTLGRARTKRLSLDWISASGGPVRFELAVLLDRLFPELEKFEVGNPGQEEAGRQVFRYLEAMQTGRRHSKLFPQEPEAKAPKLEEDSEEEGG